MLEIEIKAALKDISPNTVKAAAEKEGFLFSRNIYEKDIYFNGNDRDFRKTDEAVRLRSCSENDREPQSLITYKGPKIDENSSTRKEYETSVGDMDTAHNLLCALGYIPFFTVEKRREELNLGSVTLCMDKVTGLGDFIELETLSLSDEEKDREQAVSTLLSLLKRLGIPEENTTRKSYLELLAAKK